MASSQKQQEEIELVKQIIDSLGSEEIKQLIEYLHSVINRR